MKILIVLIFTLLNLAPTFSQTKNGPMQTDRDLMDAEIRSMMNARDELIKSLLDDDAFSQFDKRFNDLVKKFDDDNFSTTQGLQLGSVVGEYDWRETETQQILAIKVKQIKDRPLDIKIEKGFVHLKGDVEEILDYPERKGTKKISKVHFERSFSIPEGVDQTSPLFENKDGELLIKFKKLKSIKSSPVKIKNKAQSKTIEDLEPVGRDSDDPII